MSATSDTVAHLRLETAKVQPKRTAPEERGERLATLERGDSEELRVSWDVYKGRPFLSLRLWTRSSDGQWWPDRARGVTVRRHELAAFADAVEAAIERAAARDDGGGIAYD